LPFSGKSLEVLACGDGDGKAGFCRRQVEDFAEGCRRCLGGNCTNEKAAGGPAAFAA
jgi:hypothetical protein